jgi:hypothetical protein
VNDDDLDAPLIDPYLRCEEGCTHDLGRAALLSDLRDGDGPFDTWWSSVGFIPGGLFRGNG